MAGTLAGEILRYGVSANLRYGSILWGWAIKSPSVVALTILSLVNLVLLSCSCAGTPTPAVQAHELRPPALKGSQAEARLYCSTGARKAQRHTRGTITAPAMGNRSSALRRLLFAFVSYRATRPGFRSNERPRSAA